MKLNLTLLLVFSMFFGNHVLAQTIQPKYQKEVQELAKKPAIQKAFDYIIEIDAVTIQDMVTLTEIPTPTFHEKEKGLVYADMLRKAGADSVWTDEVGNVIALRKGTKSDKTIVVDAHLDTVFPFGTDVKVKQKGDTLFAPGITDANRALAVVVALVKTMSSQNIRTESDIWFTGSVGEEGLGDLKGMKHLFREGGQPIASFIAIDGRP